MSWVEKNWKINYRGGDVQRVRLVAVVSSCTDERWPFARKSQPTHIVCNALDIKKAMFKEVSIALLVR